MFNMNLQVTCLNFPVSRQLDIGLTYNQRPFPRFCEKTKLCSNVLSWSEKATLTGINYQNIKVWSIDVLSSV